MDLTQVLIALIVFGAVIYLAALLPIDPIVKKIIKVVAIVAVVIWLLKTFAPLLAL
jgi:hypothetical protein